MLYCSCQPVLLQSSERPVCLVLPSPRPDRSCRPALRCRCSASRWAAPLRAQEHAAARIPRRSSTAPPRSNATARASRRCATCRLSRRSAAHRERPRRDPVPGRHGDRSRRELAGRSGDADARPAARRHDGAPPAAGDGDRPVDARSRSPRRTCRRICRRTATRSIGTARGSTRRRTATSGIRRSRPAGGRTTTAAGRRCRRTAGRGSASTPGRGRRITTAAGATRATRGSGFRAAPGARRGCRGERRPDYVSWCPLGFDSRPVFALSVIGTTRGDHGGGGWFGWTVMSRSHFGGRGYYAHRYAVEPRIAAVGRRRSSSQSRPPVSLPRSVDSRHGAGLRSPAVGRRSCGGSRAVAPPSATQSVPCRRQSQRRRPIAARQPVGSAASAQFRDRESAAAQPSPGVGDVGGRQPTVDDAARSATARRRWRATAISAVGRLAAPDSVRQPATSFGVPRRAYPLEAPRAATPAAAGAIDPPPVDAAIASLDRSRRAARPPARRRVDDRRIASAATFRDARPDARRPSRRRRRRAGGCDRRQASAVGGAQRQAPARPRTSRAPPSTARRARDASPASAEVTAQRRTQPSAARALAATPAQRAVRRGKRRSRVASAALAPR